MGKKKAEKRGFTVHDREYWWTKDELQKELGVSKEELDQVWEGGKRAKEAVKESKKKLPAAKPKKKPSEEDVLAEMKRLAANGVTDCTSTLLRDKLALDKESGRDQIRRAMRKLEEDSKVVISQKIEGKRKHYTYRLKEVK